MGAIKNIVKAYSFVRSLKQGGKMAVGLGAGAEGLLQANALANPDVTVQSLMDMPLPAAILLILTFGFNVWSNWKKNHKK